MLHVELNAPEVQRTWVRFKFCWGRRRATRKHPAPPLPSVPVHVGDPSNDPDNVVMETPNLIQGMVNRQTAYPFLQYFLSPSAMAYEADMRNEADTHPPYLDVRAAWERKVRSEMPAPAPAP